jgi:hypothetical protein
MDAVSRSIVFELAIAVAAALERQIEHDHAFRAHTGVEAVRVHYTSQCGSEIVKTFTSQERGFDLPHRPWLSWPTTVQAGGVRPVRIKETYNQTRAEIQSTRTLRGSGMNRKVA